MTAVFDRTISYAPSPDAMESRLGDEIVILHMGSGTYFGLDEVGTVIWVQLQANQNAQSICTHVRSVFPDAPDTMDDEVTNFLKELLAHNLIQVA